METQGLSKGSMVEIDLIEIMVSMDRLFIGWI